MKDGKGGGASRTTEAAAGTSQATDVSLREHLAQRLHETERRLDERYHDLREADERFAEERDRRYTEVNIEKEKALKIKETADLAALSLAREIQAYKDEKANELRAQIESERGIYLRRDEYVQSHAALVGKVETALEPLEKYVAAQQGRGAGITATAGFMAALIVAVGAIVGIVTTILITLR